MIYLKGHIEKREGEMEKTGSLWGGKTEEVCKSVQVSLVLSEEYKYTMEVLKTGQCSKGATVQTCSGSCFVKHNFLVHY